MQDIAKPIWLVPDGIISIAAINTTVDTKYMAVRVDTSFINQFEAVS